jgi:2-keto-4-pentenoate hydratase/2-oxohepta-3-ene-1,7-dioic acid hydratase in catechol pathway
MKLMRIGDAGAERPVVQAPDGTWRDISRHVPDIGPETLADLQQMLDLSALTGLPAVDILAARAGSPIARPRNVWCIGLNYSDHAAESGMPVPKEPILFTKPGSAVSGPNDPIPLPEGSTRLDWEVELGVVIGTPALNITEDKALDHVFGYVAANDVSERDWQMERGGQWSKGKGYPGFCPCGPVLVSRDEVRDPQALGMELSVNGAVMQTGSTATMIFGVAHIVAYLSRFVLLEPGDLILTGTPPGVGMGKTPPRYLADGDRVSLSVEGLGRQENTVRSV